MAFLLGSTTDPSCVCLADIDLCVLDVRRLSIANYLPSLATVCSPLFCRRHSHFHRNSLLTTPKSTFSRHTMSAPTTTTTAAPIPEPIPVPAPVSTPAAVAAEEGQSTTATSAAVEPETAPAVMAAAEEAKPVEPVVGEVSSSAGGTVASTKTLETK